MLFLVSLKEEMISVVLLGRKAQECAYTDCAQYKARESTEEWMNV